MNKNSMCDIRRRILMGSVFGLAMACAMGSPRASAQEPIIDYHGGRINPPLPVPDVTVRMANGSATGLSGILQGHVTAVQLIFTGCSSTCPIQGAMFRRVQSLLPDLEASGMQLLSLSIDPMGDRPEDLSKWLERFDAQPGWIAAVPDLKGADLIQNIFGNGRTSLNTHATQVQITNPHGDLFWRTYELPAPESVADLLRASTRSI